MFYFVVVVIVIVESERIRSPFKTREGFLWSAPQEKFECKPQNTFPQLCNCSFFSYLNSSFTPWICQSNLKWEWNWIGRWNAFQSELPRCLRVRVCVCPFFICLHGPCTCPCLWLACHCAPWSIWPHTVRNRVVGVTNPVWIPRWKGLSAHLLTVHSKKQRGALFDICPENKTQLHFL